MNNEASPKDLSQMLVLSHRGLWTRPQEKNTLAALRRSLDEGFGLETYIRDHNGKLVISHDPPAGNCPDLESFLECYKQAGKDVPLALNIKSDGLRDLLRDVLIRYAVHRYFLFDLSIPQARQYLGTELALFTRQSEDEPQPAHYAKVAGVWMDCFESDWITEADVEKHLKQNKQVCIVSPELHRRKHQNFWRRMKQWECLSNDNVMLCTDYPRQARGWFNAHN
jgi:hypothetical protein